MESNSISAVIIDDEPEAINLLEMYLRHFPSVTVTGKELHSEKGLELVKNTLPELVFLDIDMPDMNGLQVAHKIHAENNYTEIVFTTAHQHYAYDALGVEPIDFLTKPFCIEDLSLVIQKYEAKAEKKKAERKLNQFLLSQTNSPKIKLPTLHGVIIVEMNDIALIKSKANYCVIHLKDGSNEIVSRNLISILKIVNSSTFFQTDRATIINLNYLKRIDKKNLKCVVQIYQTEKEEPITKNQITYFEKLDLFPFVQNS